MRSPGEAGAPSAKDFAESKKTAKKPKSMMNRGRA
jgi:hypothetical protein